MILDQLHALFAADGADHVSALLAALGLLFAAEIVLLTVIAVCTLVLLVALFAVVVAALALRSLAVLFRPGRSRRAISAEAHRSSNGRTTLSQP